MCKRIFVLFFLLLFCSTHPSLVRCFPSGFWLNCTTRRLEEERLAPCVFHTLAVHRVSAASVQACKPLRFLTHTTPPSLSLLIKWFL